jgi:hypothetical protein
MLWCCGDWASKVRLFGKLAREDAGALRLIMALFEGARELVAVSLTRGFGSFDLCESETVCPSVVNKLDDRPLIVNST